MRGNHFLVHGHKKDLPHITCIFHHLKYVVKTFFSVSDFTSHFFAKTLTLLLFDGIENNLSQMLTLPFLATYL